MRLLVAGLIVFAAPFSMASAPTVGTASSPASYYMRCDVDYYRPDGVSIVTNISKDFSSDPIVASEISTPLGTEAVIARFEGFGQSINAWQPTFAAGFIDTTRTGVAREIALTYANDLSLDSRSPGSIVTLTGHRLGTWTFDNMPVSRIDYACSLIRKP